MRARLQVERAHPGRVPFVHGARRARRFFDRLAPFYDRVNARIYKREWLRRVRGHLQGRVLDVGVGTGFTTGHLADAVGIDLSKRMIDRARYAGHLMQADFLHPPLRPGSFDTIVFAGSFYYLDDPGQGLRIASDLLRPGGRVVILSPGSRIFALAVPVYTEAEYRRLFHGGGFHMDSFEPLNWAACLVIARKG